MQLDKGKIITDKDFRTTAKSGNIFAIGDCISGPMLAHKVPAHPLLSPVIWSVEEE